MNVALILTKNTNNLAAAKYFNLEEPLQQVAVMIDEDSHQKSF